LFWSLDGGGETIASVVFAAGERFKEETIASVGFATGERFKETLLRLGRDIGLL